MTEWGITYKSNNRPTWTVRSSYVEVVGRSYIFHNGTFKMPVAIYPADEYFVKAIS